MRTQSLFFVGASRASGISAEALAGLSEGNPVELQRRVPQMDDFRRSLRLLLHHPLSFDYLLRFMELEFCSENAMFWVAVEDFKHSGAHGASLKDQARDICKTYVDTATAGSMEINIKDATRAAVVDCANAKPGALPITISMFDAAQAELESLMEFNHLGRFLESPQAESLAARIQKLSNYLEEGYPRRNGERVKPYRHGMPRHQSVTASSVKAGLPLRGVQSPVLGDKRGGRLKGFMTMSSSESSTPRTPREKLGDDVFDRLRTGAIPSSGSVTKVLPTDSDVQRELAQALAELPSGDAAHSLVLNNREAPFAGVRLPSPRTYCACCH